MASISIASQNRVNPYKSVHGREIYIELGRNNTENLNSDWDKKLYRNAFLSARDVAKEGSLLPVSADNRQSFADAKNFFCVNA